MRKRVLSLSIERAMPEVLRMCACIGPSYGEPFCECKMAQRGLPLNEAARNAARERVMADLEKVFGEGKP